MLLHEEGLEGQFLLRSSSIICIAILSSSSISVLTCSCLLFWSHSENESEELRVIIELFPPSSPPFFPKGTIMTQLESEQWPARFCHTPMWEFSGSSLKQVMEGEGSFPHFRSFAWRISSSSFEVDGVWCVGVSVFGSPSGVWSIGKLVFAFRPLIRIAAWSYARAASSAVSNVPSHTLLLLFHAPNIKILFLLRKNEIMM